MVQMTLISMTCTISRQVIQCSFGILYTFSYLMVEINDVLLFFMRLVDMCVQRPFFV